MDILMAVHTYTHTLPQKKIKSLLDLKMTAHLFLQMTNVAVSRTPELLAK